jgi:hypothetical protein
VNLLFEIYKKLILKEAVSTNSITNSIENKYRVTINYEGDPSHGVAPGLRTIEVYAYGLTSAGNPVIRAYQPYGDTATKVPGWKFFRIDRIKSWKPTYSLVTTPAPGFNPSGDRSMSEVYSIADFTKKTNHGDETGPKQTYKPVGQLQDIDKILSDREKEIQRRKEQSKTISKPKPNQKIQEPKVNGVQQITKEPENNDAENNQNIASFGQPINNNNNNNNSFKTNGDEELEKVKDLNRRLDNTRKIDLNTIPKR